MKATKYISEVIYPKRYAPDKRINGDDWFIPPCDYDPLLNHLGEILLKEDEKDYSGDSYVLYRDNPRYGYLCFGWGSCSGCDALQACESYEDIDQLIESLRMQIKWFDSPSELLAFFDTHDWRGDFISSEETRDKFLLGARKILQSEQGK
mgnify:CR=1 FL=1